MFFFRNNCELIFRISLLIIYFTPYLNGVAQKSTFSGDEDFHETKSFSSKIETAKKRLERSAGQNGDVTEIKEKYFERNKIAMVKCPFKESDKFKYA